MSNPQADLYAALSRAQARARAVEKDARNQFHKYDYASAEAILHESKECLTSEGLAVIPSKLFCSPLAEQWQGAVAMLNATWIVVHAAGGSLVIEGSWPVIPEKGRPYDKALAAARTASLGYLLRDLLNLPRVEKGTDLDANERDQHHAEPPTPEQGDAIVACLDQLGIEKTREGRRAYLEGSPGLFAPENKDEAKAIIAELQKRVGAIKAKPAQRTPAQSSRMRVLVEQLGVTLDEASAFIDIVADGVDAKSAEGAVEVIRRLEKRLEDKA